MAFHRAITDALVGASFEVFGDGEQTRDFTFVGDAVSGTIAAAHHGIPGTSYNIGGGSRRSMNDVRAILSELLGGSVAWAYVGKQLGDARNTAADISRAREDLGFEPSARFELGLKAQLEWQQTAMLTRDAPR
jgi:UDP-glucose 4-epimerase